ncbi:MAG TPA: TauD/TfdA family dioxygenase [Caulobacteraceae bacterium]|nr:TauD/TfdA family dioxygenase [Caulobacteraceae bacterium]
MILHPIGRFDNAPADNREIEVRPLAAAMGAEIVGGQLTRLSDAAFAEVRAALFRHKMICFRGQDVSRAEHERFSLRFGPFAPDAYTKGVEHHPDVQPVIREADARAGMVFGSGWHTDSPFLPQPPSISMLYAVDVPPWGGDTMWANAALAYATLSDAMKTMLAPLRVRMSMRRVLETAQTHQAPDETPLGRIAATRGQAQLPAQIARKVEGASHPLVRTHPVTGEKALYCDHTYAIGIDGLTPEEASPLLRFLADHVTQPAFTCRLRWEAGTFALWDNRLCVHQAFNDTDGFRRELYRTTVAGETPA